MRSILFLGLSLFSLLSFSQLAIAKKNSLSDVRFEADKVERDTRGKFVDAIGTAQFEWRDYFLIADRIRYFEEKKSVLAFGNVILIEPNGNFVFAQKARLDADWQTGDLENAAILFEDNSKLTARFVKRDSSPSGLGRRKQMRQASYSPCKVCRNEKNYPLWQLSASKITHYEKSKTIYYNNLFLEFFGIPVLYIPFFIHPDPSVKRRTGLLTPSITYSSNLGAVFETPFTIDFSPQTSLVLTPKFTNREGVKLQADWKHWIKLGKYNLSASGAHDYHNKFSGHVFSDGDFNFSNNISLSYNGEWASDDDYLELFNITRKRKLNSDLTFNWSDRNTSLTIKNSYTKTLTRNTLNNDISQPDLLILPNINFTSSASFLGGRAFINADTLFLLHQKNQVRNISNVEELEKKRTRFSGEIGWKNNWIAWSSALRFYSSVRYDFYQIRFEEMTGVKIDKKEFKRILPVALLEWRFPLVKNSSTQFTQLVEPIVQLIYAPYSSKKNQPPNKDSRNFTFTYNNLFKINRFSGFDEWESGPRANIGLKLSVYNSKNFSTSLAFGKIFRLRKSQDFNAASKPDNSGAGDKDSDIVAVWDMSSPYVSFSQSARFDRNKTKLQQYDSSANLTFASFNLSLDYTLNQSGTKLQELSYKITAPISKYWEVWGGGRYSLFSGDILHYEGGLRYDDECFKMDINFSQYENQTLARDNEFKVGLKLTFTNLGDLNFNAK